MSKTMNKTMIKINKHHSSRGPEDGFVLLSAAAALILLLGMCGLAVDVGRMYITKNETQAYADSAALDAAMKLDGSAAGIQAASAVVAATVNTWQFNTTSFTGTTVDFSQDGVSGWDSSPVNPANANPPHGLSSIVPGVTTGMVTAEIIGEDTHAARVRVSITNFPFNFFSPWIAQQATARTIIASVPYEHGP
jgi:uncharacterized membrane protein